ncbi:hypothetical protein [Burkholderia stagnalis]|uniref:Uncharacterized protein n=1 Tax=Burkholderia stagnalis TaxID=1503054 RepID=A0A119H204_9BURK|nr:hypothetical protein [Burkholderia stagnalis]KVZ03355.1 hypothetical protein WT35_28085 [Burkholderia stagnalis]KWA48364.1 hypothetical protein WT43_32405 [Burkholderia stagnalis]KWA51690.1 hypothetical protein WT42_16560 [Burkholderia stagnalis]KWA62671.1 hypothetical protein WT44_13660 [Burkholderia stagnalis]KWC98310.1 hypothetical protein WT46_23645 [Burkholderia stagnalis]
MRRSILRCVGVVTSIGALPAAGLVLDPICIYFAGRVSTTSEALVVGFLVGQVLNLMLLSVMDSASNQPKEVT